MPDFGTIVKLIKEKFRSDSPIILQDCKHEGEFTRIHKELIMCNDCHRTYKFTPWLSEIKLTKFDFDKLISNRRNNREVGK